jgi:hypothetical protein
MALGLLRGRSNINMIQKRDLQPPAARFKYPRDRRNVRRCVGRTLRRSRRYKYGPAVSTVSMSFMMHAVLRSPAEAALVGRLTHRDLAALRLCCSGLREVGQTDMDRERAARDMAQRDICMCRSLLQHRMAASSDWINSLAGEGLSYEDVWASVRAKAAELGMTEARVVEEWHTFVAPSGAIAVSLHSGQLAWTELVLHLRGTDPDTEMRALLSAHYRHMTLLDAREADPLSTAANHITPAPSRALRLLVDYPPGAAEWAGLPAHLVTLRPEPPRPDDPAPAEYPWLFRAVAALLPSWHIVV